MDVFSFHSNQSICAYKNIGDNFGNNQILPKEQAANIGLFWVERCEQEKESPN
ncbi:MAG: hypothetical protein ACLUGQ_08310 [Coprococcus sp.]